MKREKTLAHDAGEIIMLNVATFSIEYRRRV